MKRLDIKPVLVGMILVLAANPAFAQDFSLVSNMIDNMITAVTGPIGRGLAVLWLVGAGGMVFFGRLNWPVFVAIFVGVVLIFSAEAIVGGFASP